MEFKVLQKILAEEDNVAADIRRLLQKHHIAMVNLISSPGSGKTTLLEKTLPMLSKRYRLGVIEGDVETDRDAQRLRKCEVPMVLVNTHGACHLNSMTIFNALQELPLHDLDLVFIENIGNLVCPAEFDVGEAAKIAVLSTPEGDDKPLKYPFLFRESRLCLLNKIDLLESVDFNRKRFYGDLKAVNPLLPVIEISATKGEGLEQWVEWLEAVVQQSGFESKKR